MLALGPALALALAAVPPPAVAPASAAAAQPPAQPTVEATFEHDLVTPTGLVRLTWPSISYDRENGEIFVAAEGFVRIFDASGMEVHRFGDDGSLGNVSRAVVLEDGAIVVLTTLNGRRAYFRCDFRGEPTEQFGLTGLPQELADFNPDQMVYRDGALYFAERGTMRVVVTDLSGAFRRSVALRDLVATAIVGDTDRKPPAGMDAFNVDGSGNLLFTMSTMFAAGVVSPAGEVRLFGSRGSRPGKFNIIGGIDADERGYVFVTDRLRSVVSVWDGQLRHLGDFGYRGDDPSNLLTPYEIAVGNGHVFVAQAGKRGVKVFRVRLVVPEPPKPPPPGPQPLGARAAP
ncbi:NHL repeat-containing protein [Anaeromyxobacter oryzae]|uniref:SMP-30/Gluconolactonase/LRE-like region domain-containing protein n=1 Tax=Anaeromyxobacter oryzae TaxID=2918170 RepID=A0ABM7X0D8_9BACT|nr:hypothetical protein [Anaeromyxobacter oryzae]BDG05250.1 hypothetical protein AMOR_42460 [Anaeromyxobacter oryzae]